VDQCPLFDGTLTGLGSSAAFSTRFMAILL
jgi:hypothetical protein